MKIWTVLIGCWDAIEFGKLALFTNKTDAIIYCNECGFIVHKWDAGPGSAYELYYGGQSDYVGTWCNIIGPTDVDVEFKDGEV